jgi:RNA polymerase sigma factor (sigma-70 family)
MALLFPAKLEDRFNFVKFYELNRKEVDLILWHVCWKHTQLFEPRELFSELFLRLSRSYILNDFNPEKAQLHTYFTTMTNCYAQHIVRKEIHRLEKSGHVVLCQGINFLDADERAPELIAQTPDLDQEISIKELLDGIKKQCATSEQYEKLITMYLEDASQWATIASSLGISMAYAQKILQKIKRNLQTWRLKNKESFSELSFDRSKIEYEIEHKPEIKNSPDHKKGFVVNSTSTKKKESVVNNKNHHPKAKVRPLTEAEVKKIRNRFIELDGVIPDDTWANLKKVMSEDISVFQITGQVVGLHREVEQGTIVLKNKRAYTLSIKARRNKWATYNSKKYKDFAARTGLRVKKVTASIAKRVKATVAKKAQSKPIAPKATSTVLQKICLRILKKDNTFETKEIEAKSKDISKTDIPKLLKWKTVPENVLDYMVVA